MSYDYTNKKVSIVLSSTLEPSIASNVIGHLSISLGAYVDTNGLMGRAELFDKSGIKHIGISKYPVITTKLKPSKLKTLINNIKHNYQDLFIVDYPKEMLDTGHDDELSNALLEKTEDELEFLGALVYGDTELINGLTGKFSLWRG